MKNTEKFNAYDEVIVEGKDGIFTVEAYFEQMFIGSGKTTYELWYTVRDRKFGGIYEVRYDQISSAAQKKKDNMNKLLDEYNSCLKLEKILGNPECGIEAKFVLDKMKNVTE